MFISAENFTSGNDIFENIKSKNAIARFSSYSLDKLELELPPDTKLELVVDLNCSLDYTFNLETDSYLKIIFISNFQELQNFDDVKVNVLINLKRSGSAADLYFLNQQNKGNLTINLSINHLCEDTKSKSLIKSINAGSSNLDANGTIAIYNGSNDSEAKMSLNGLLLDTKSKVKFQPNLKIYENTVNCSHGSTISNLDSEYLDYFYARGVNQNEAKKILINAFKLEITEQVPLLCLDKELDT